MSKLSSERFLLYEDEEIKIEVANWFHKAMSKLTTIESIPIEDIENFTTIIDKIDRNLFRKGIILKGPAMPASVPVIRFCECIAIQYPFDIFNKVLYYLAWFPSIVENAEEIAEAIELFSDEEVTYYCDIWEQPIEQIQGYILAIKDEKQYLLLFSTKEELSEEIE